jgi:hypothetical protein
VPARGAVVLAAAGATALTLLWTWLTVAFGLGRRLDGSVNTGPTVLELHDWQGWLVVVVYAPLLLWGPLLGALTIAYWRRRRSEDSRIADADRSGDRFRSPSTMAG